MHPTFNGNSITIITFTAGVDCDEVFPGIILGNGATVKKRDYLKRQLS